MRPLFHLGRYFITLGYFFRKPENWRMYLQEIIRQMYSMGVGSLMIVVVISFFMGAVITLQTAYQLVSPLVPVYVVASIVRESTILELSVSVLSLVLAGKIGSSLATELGNGG
jgi:phospholipid/cholesterol/gamma-HCH transport system permease protein